jgi:hypothetical protein
MMMNEYDIEEAVRLFDRDDTPNLAYAAESLYRLMVWTNRNSDGFIYWNKPQQAANRLIELITPHVQAARFGYYPGTADRLHDVSKGDVTKALTPVKSFLTRQGVDHTLVVIR